ncbi:GtrA family protein [Candidatus Kaiserbacteria bacterium]|nr:GtrA family protein [Candidatus Kaiserbacteria bacterium]
MRLREFLAVYRDRFLFLARVGASGLVGGVIQVLFLFMWVTVLGLEGTYLLGLIFGFIVALVATFTLQKYWAFRDFESNRTSRQLLSYSVVAVSGLALNTALLSGAKILFGWFSLDFFHGWYLIAQIGITGIVAVSNFCLNFFFTFRHARQGRLWER